MNSQTTFAPSPSGVTGHLLRQATGRFATGITVITVPKADGTHHGMTANSFISVSLEPPLVLVSVGNQSRTKLLLDDESRFGISILAQHQALAAAHYSGKTQDVEPLLSSSEGVAHVEGALARLSCTVVDRHLAGDHTLFIASVDDVSFEDGQPLIFNQGRMLPLAHYPAG
ncbi:flavin reductase family protein [Arthrobacter sp. KNU40]|uniref:flavin reductase family protein n=1 Tax=Arthrobacter sp. KNU40 TaxID=3447965 RepID=UPI003F610172